MSVKFSYVVL